MSTPNYDHMIAVLQAAKEGKTIEYRLSSVADWRSTDREIQWNFGLVDYRVKPEPREFWLVKLDNELFPRAFPCKQVDHANIHVREVIE